ncbi:hypothetical protein BH18ACT9_BH18ACT9_03170 [soil metagenome]
MAVSLLSLASAVVVVGVSTQSPAWLAGGSMLALGCGWAAARIVYTDLVQTRRDDAAARAVQAQGYRGILAERSAEHAELTGALLDRLTTRQREIADLTSSVVEAEHRAAAAETQGWREAHRADDAHRLVVELREQIAELEIGKAEDLDQLASWEGSETVVDMMAWEQRNATPPEAGSEKLQA